MLRKIVLFTLLILLISSTVTAFNLNKLVWFSLLETDGLQSKDFYYLNKENAKIINGYKMYELNPIIRKLNKKEHFNYRQINKFAIIELKKEYDLNYVFYTMVALELYNVIKNDKTLKTIGHQRWYAISYGFAF